jgi:2Fe-2S ferredoxin
MTKLATITFIEHDGNVHVIEAAPGQSLMECAVQNGVAGIYADCFGEGGCATCHVYVDPTWCVTTGQPGTREKSTLRFAFKPQTLSRLACYIRIEEELDGLVVRLPERQF